MARANIPASVISQRGIEITFIDGSKATVVYTFSSLMSVEEHFGSIVGALQEVNGGMTAQAFTSVARLVACGLEHEERDGVTLSDVDALRGLLDPMLFDSYAEAAGEALNIAFPESDDKKDGEGDADPQKGSRGESGGTSAA